MFALYDNDKEHLVPMPTNENNLYNDFLSLKSRDKGSTKSRNLAFLGRKKLKLTILENSLLHLNEVTHLPN